MENDKSTIRKRQSYRLSKKLFEKLLKKHEREAKAKKNVKSKVAKSKLNKNNYRSILL